MWNVCLLLISSLWVLEDWNEFSPEPSLLQTEQTQLSAFPNSRGAQALWSSLQPSSGFALTASHPSCVGGPRPGHSTPDGSSGGQSRGAPLPPCPCWPLLSMQPMIPLAFQAARAHCWLMSSFSFTRFPKSFLAGLRNKYCSNYYQRQKMHSTGSRGQHPPMSTIFWSGWKLWHHITGLYGLSFYYYIILPL